MKKTTLKDIAERLGLSQNTISVALRGNPGINPETRELILQTAQEMGYTPKIRHGADRKNILLISKAATASDPYFFNHLFGVIQNEINALGYTLLTINTDDLKISFDTPHEFRQYLEQNKIAGFLILGDIDETSCKLLCNQELPIVGASFYLPGVPMSCVVEDNISGAYMLVEYLVTRGYQRIGFIGNLDNISFWERFSSFKGSMMRFGLSNSGEYDLLGIDSSNANSMEQLNDMICEMNRLPEAFVCCNDHMAAVTLKVLYNQGLRCPEDVAVVGFDNNEICRLSTPTITSIDTSRNLQGVISVRLLDQRITGKQKQDQRLVLPVRLQEGLSVAEHRVFNPLRV